MFLTGWANSLVLGALQNRSEIDVKMQFYIRWRSAFGLGSRGGLRGVSGDGSRSESQGGLRGGSRGVSRGDLRVGSLGGSLWRAVG